MTGRPGRYSTAGALNLDAGDHPISGDPQELQAGGRAADRSWSEFPYYEMRYGGRGRLFGESDTGWLLTLCDGDPGFALEQVLWLGRVLSSRGMPRWLLERHLEFLHEELLRAFPRQAERYALFPHAAAELRTTRERHLPAAASRAVAGRFAERVGPAWAGRLPEAGMLLAAAVADERAGIGGAVTSLEPWMTDPARFPPEWADAVRDALAHAREHVLPAA